MTISRTKKLTDSNYSPTIPDSEEDIRSQIDGAIQEVLDLGEANFTNKTGDHLGTWRGLTPTAAEPGLSATVEAHLADYLSHGIDAVSPLKFGAVGNANYFKTADKKYYADAAFTIEATDDTTAIQNTIAYCVANKRAMKLSRKYLISKIALDTIYPFNIISEGGELVGMGTGSYTCMLDIVDASRINIVGALEIRGSYNVGYDCAIWVRTLNAQACVFHNFYDINFSACKLPWKFGDLTKPDATISEITVYGGNFWGCPANVEVIGAQTIINFIGTNFVSDYGGGDATWQAIPKQTIKTIGGSYRIVGGEILNVIGTTGKTFVMQPIPSVTEGGNKFGTIYCSNVVIESASQLAYMHNPDSLTSPIKGVLHLEQCSGYHAGNSVDYIYADSGYFGKIIIDKCNFYAGVARTYANVKAIEATCQIYVDDISFGTNFIKGLAGIVGGEVHFSHRMILDVKDAQSQAISDTGISQAVIFKVVNEVGELSRFSGGYSTTTGEFTVPSGGLDNVQIFTSLYPGEGITSANIVVTINDVVVKLERISVSGSTTVLAKSLGTGSKIKIKILPIGASGNLNQANYNTFQIFASH